MTTDLREVEDALRSDALDALGAAASRLAPERLAAIARTTASRQMRTLVEQGLVSRRQYARMVFAQEWARWLAEGEDRGPFQTSRVAARAEVTDRAIRYMVEQQKNRKERPRTSARGETLGARGHR